MRKMKTLITGAVLALILAVGAPTILPVTTAIVEAATIKLNKSKITLVNGKSYTLKITGTKNKVSWKSSKPTVATVNSKGKVTAKKKGTTTITATVKKKKYTCKVTVNPKDGDREQPISAWNKNTLTFKQHHFENGQKVSFQLLEYIEGDEANRLVHQYNGNTPQPNSNQKFVLMKFKIDHLEGDGDLYGDELISNFFNSNATKKVDVGDFDDRIYTDDSSGSLYERVVEEGESVTGWTAILIDKNIEYLTFRVPVDFDSKSAAIYKWFTTKKP